MKDSRLKFIFVFTIILSGFFAFAHSASAATFTSKANGNWSASGQTTWNETGVPGVGDTITITHTVTVDQNTTIGTSPDDTTTYVITISNPGVLIVPNGVTLTVRGNINNNSGSGSGNINGVQVQGSGILELDGSQVGAARNYMLKCGEYGRVSLSGTDTNNRATIQSNTSGGYGQFTALYATQGCLNSNYGKIYRFGDSTHEMGYYSIVPRGSETISITNTLFDTNGIVPIKTAASKTVVFQGNTITNSQSSAHISAKLTGITTGSFLCDSNIFDIEPFIFANDMVLTNNYFGSGFTTDTNSTAFTTTNNNFFRHYLTIISRLIYGGLSNTYFLHDEGDDKNYFNVQVKATADGQSISNNIFDYTDTSPTAPDGMLPKVQNAAYTMTIANNINLPDKVGVSSGAWLNLYDDLMAGHVNIVHNTAISVEGSDNVSSETGIYVGELNRGYVGMITVFKSNLIWTPTGETGGMKMRRNNASVVQDYVAAENADYNWGWNLGEGYSGNGYDVKNTTTEFFSSGVPDTHGGSGDPQFVDPTRNVATAYTTLFGQSAGSAWESGHGTYSIGDIVSNTDVTMWGGATISFRCIASHDASTANSEPGVGSAYRTYWEISTLYYLRQDLSRIATLYTWVQNGFKVQNASLNNAGHDGLTIGAVSFIDVTAPTVTTFGIPSTSNSLTVSFTTPFTATDNVAVTGYLVNESSTPPAAGADGWSGTAQTQYVFSTTGDKTLYAWAKDAAGNVSTGVPASVTVDMTGPTGTVSNGNGTPTNDTTPTFNLTIADAGIGITGAQMQFSCDSVTWSTWEAYATPKTDFNVRTGSGCTDADGSKTVYVKYKDSLGNVGSSYNTGAFTLDTVSSNAALSGTPTSLTNSTSASITVAGTDIVAYKYKLDSGSYGSETLVATTLDLSSLDDSEHTVSVIGKDSAGNWQAEGSATTYTWTVDTTAPVVTFTIPSTSSSLTITFTSFSASDTNGVTGYLVNETATTPAIDDAGWAGTAQSSYAFSSAGAKTLYAWAKDEVGNISTAGTGSVTVTLPVATPVSSGGGGSPAIWTLPTVPLSGFKLTINSGALTTSNRNVLLGFNAGTDIKKIAISMKGDFTDASQEDYVAFKQWDLCSKFGGAIKNTTCSDGQYAVYVKFYTAYGRSSNSAMASRSIVLKSGGATENLQQIIDLPFTNLFTKYLQYRQTNADIKRLQIFLNSDPDTKIANSGAGSPGKETNFFGLLTKKAVIKFQEKYAKDVLLPWGFKKGTGYVGKTTLLKINELIENK